MIRGQRRSTGNTSGRNPGTGFAAGGMLAILSITSASAVYPDYSSRSQAISYLGGSGVPTGVFWNVSVLLAGILWLYSTYLFSRSEGHNLSSFFLYPAGLGFILVGLSPWNVFPVTHYLGANLIFLSGALSSVSVSRRVRGPMSGISLFAGVISIVSYISGYFGSYNILGPGGIERMIFYPILLWEIAFGGYLMSAYTKGRSSSGA